MDKSEKLYNRIIHERVMQETGINIKGKNGTGLAECQEGTSGGNDTVLMCPISLANNQQKKEFLVLVHNPMGGQGATYAKVKLPSKLYQAQKWEKDSFQPIQTDILEQSHFAQEGTDFMDYDMIIPNEFGANQISVFKISKITLDQYT